MKLVAGIAAAFLLAGCGSPPATLTDPSAPTVTHVKATTKPRPAHRILYSSSCNDSWPKVMQTSPPRLVSEVWLHNRGSRATSVKVWTVWYFFGGGSDRQTLSTITLWPGQNKRVAVSKPTDMTELLKMTGWKHGDRMCQSHVTMLG